LYQKGQKSEKKVSCLVFQGIQMKKMFEKTDTFLNKKDGANVIYFLKQKYFSGQSHLNFKSPSEVFIYLHVKF